MSLSSRRRLQGLGTLLALVAITALPLFADERQDTGAATADAWNSDASAIVVAGDNAARLEAIRQRLQATGFEVTGLPFTSGDHQGLNLLAEVAGDADAPLLLLGAHADRVDEGEGAVDNASGVAVALALAERFRERPLQGHRVAVAFWDLEERGLLGARDYVASGGEQPALYVNFDVFGWGDTLWMMAPELSDPLVSAGDSAAESAGTGFSATAEHYPPTDHLAFLRAGWPAVSYSLMDAEEISAVEAMMQGNQPDAPPRVMQVIHTAQDTREQLDPAAVARGIDAVEAALRAWDAGA
ncbi:MAG: M28 family metallopeptidase [Luteimonas sp.]